MKKALSILLLLPCLSFAKAPEVLENAMNGYLKDGNTAFITHLIKGSALEDEKSVLTQSNMISQIEAYYGALESWEVLADCPLTDRIRTTYYTMYYENGPVYGYLTTYKKKQGNEVTTKFLFHTEAERILPYTPIQKDQICDSNS
ncbi:hypothetical protein PRUB_a2474 [Pseudoalteromonas rubra]|uniref:DUF3887 domain-containing protein n=1 Tax=Pseudoalteromonas rubra TaxID=43658 RepID=A0A8T0CD05_9GAMM|nr:hypothetical protein [Pseudoalteromonas rubra]KAF7787942.1 hypothetical protein PRUB_a2474 [Pseudoalteromonas rubra]